MMDWPLDDEQAIRDAYWNVGTDETVMDVGAHHGTYTLPALGAGAYVIAIDPNTHTQRWLTANAAGYGWQHRLKTYDYALHDGAPVPQDLLAQVKASPHAECAPAFTGQATIDWLTGSLARLDRIKIDVEGAELGVIEGARKTLARFRPLLLIEDHTRIYPWCAEHRTAERITSLLEGADYHVSRIEHECPGGADRDFIFAAA